MAIDQADRLALRRQLGREPRGVVRVERRCPAGHPLVIKVYPLVRRGEAFEPFPTLFWLTCPRVVEQVSRLEHRGWIARLEARLRRDLALRNALREDHRRYRQERWETLTPEDRARLEARGWAQALRERGIGGIADWDHLKCLHLHYAHHLARGNAIGRWLEVRVPIALCRGEEGPAGGGHHG